MKFSYSAVWDDTVRMLRGNASLLLAIAGVFLFLPALLMAYFVPPPEGATTLAAAIADFEVYFSNNWHWTLLSNIVNMIGAIAIYLLLFDGRGRTVGGAIAGALPILPFYFLLSVISGLIIFFGFVWLILPGVYLLGRFVISSPAMVAEARRSPFDAMRRSWALTKGKGWAVAGLVVLVAIVGYVLTLAITAVLGSVFLLVGGREGVGGLLTLILGGALGAVFSTVLVVLFGAIYRHVAAGESAAR